ncbi:MAG: PP2C family protein-serine/threonine phosphatase [Coraliomargaritaceae bacterium]
MKIRSYGATHMGQVRISNEDAFFLSEIHGAFAVADGIGGLPGGAQTSERIISLLERAYKPDDSQISRYDLTELTKQINQIISEEVAIAHPETGAGSTLTLSQIQGNELHVAHVGDSTAYLFHQGHLEKLTSDHTMEQELINAQGEEARNTMPPEYAHTLTRCIGQPRELTVDHIRAQLAPADKILLCTDGLNKVIGETAIEKILQSDDSPEVICQSMIDTANALRGPDNITVIVAIIESLDPLDEA